MMGNEYTIADIAIFPWVRNLVGFYGAGDLVGFADFKEVQRVLDAFRGTAGGGERAGDSKARLTGVRHTPTGWPDVY
jgi:glutathione S-transferase